MCSYSENLHVAGLEDLASSFWPCLTSLSSNVTEPKLQYFGHFTLESATELASTVLEGCIEGNRHGEKPRGQWLDDVEEQTDNRSYIK